MIRLRLALVAENIIRDAATNSVSAFNILDELNSHGYPLLLPKLAAVVVLARDKADPQEHTLRMRTTVNGDQINEFDLHINFQGALVTRGVMMFQGFIVPQPGVLAFAFSLNDKALATYELEARLVDAPPPKVTAG